MLFRSPLAWFDVSLPNAVWTSSMLVFGGCVFAGFAAWWWRKGVALLVIALVIVALPTYLLMLTADRVGDNVQPRYLLPLLVIFTGVALLRRDPQEHPTMARSQRWIIVGLLSFANAVALHTTIRRYVTGTDRVNFDLNVEVEWWWPVPFSPMLLWSVGSLAFAIAVWVVLRQVPDEVPIRSSLASAADRRRDVALPRHRPSHTTTVHHHPDPAAKKDG